MNPEDFKKLAELRLQHEEEERRKTVEAPSGVDADGMKSAWEKVIEEREERQRALGAWEPHYDPDNLPPGFHVKGVSTLRRGDGSVALRWEKTSIDRSIQIQLLRDAFASIAEEIPQVEPTPEPESTDDDLIAVYPMGDPHLGMLSWAPETGDDFDLKIATRNLLDASDWLVRRAPPASTAMLINLGDFFHADNNMGQTSRSGHNLDTDTRWPKMLKAGVMTMVRIIDRALEKHDRVVVRNEIGNHDDHSSIMLAIALGLRYQDEPRVLIDESPNKFWYYRFGRCLFGTTHGNGIKLNDLGEIMAFDERENWGATRFRHWYVGHVHHESLKEKRGVTIETFRTLAPRDAWTHAAGYRSGRDMRCDVWHRDYGLETRHVVGVERLMRGLRL